MFTRRLDGAVPAFATLVAAMICLSATVPSPIIRWGWGWRWIVAVLAVGVTALGVAVAAAHGDPVRTARGDLVVQAALALVVAGCFVGIHRAGRRLRVQ